MIIVIVYFTFFSIISCVWFFFREGEGEEAERKGGRERERDLRSGEVVSGALLPPRVFPVGRRRCCCWHWGIVGQT